MSDQCGHALGEILLDSLSGVGPRVSTFFKKLEIFSVWDLLVHLPMRYENRTELTPLHLARNDHPILIEVEIESVTVMSKRQSQLICKVSDGTDTLQIRFFHFKGPQIKKLQDAKKIRCYGEIRYSATYGKEMVHPEYQILDHYHPPLDQHLTAVYSTTKGLPQWLIRKVMRQSLAIAKKILAPSIDFPASLLQEYSLPSLIESLQWIHCPPPKLAVEEFNRINKSIQNRLAFEELLAHQLALHRLRQEIRVHRAPNFKSTGELRNQLEKQLPFHLTNAQKKVVAEIVEDLKQPHPMLRLVQGDVGSGKTIVAAMAMLEAVENGYQAALMAPTELLAEQHFQNFKAWAEPLGLQVAWLSGALPKSKRGDVLRRIQEGDAQIVIGTHVLFQESILFHRLGLLVIDEQHRFGVEQRLALLKKGEQQDYLPHQLIMTATPIPRTLAMMTYSDLDCSIIDEVPPGRKVVESILASNNRRQEIIEHVKTHCESQKQAYWVCTLIDESEVLVCQAAEITAKELQQQLPHLKIALIHGRLKADEKEKLMRNFKQGEIDLLVATTVIEVGVDVKNASLMIIENAERLGLSQLHQLRGRVGRGHDQSYCVFLYQKPLSVIAKKRLQVIRETHDGFEIARQDLEIRGPGEVLGIKQAGLAHLRVADLVRDQELLPKVQEAGEKLTQHYPHIIESLVKRWLHRSNEYFRI